MSLFAQKEVLQRQQKHLVGIVKAIVGHGVAAIGGFRLVAGKFLPVGDDVRQRQVKAVGLRQLAQGSQRVGGVSGRQNRLPE